MKKETKITGLQEGVQKCTPTPYKNVPLILYNYI